VTSDQKAESRRGSAQSKVRYLMNAVMVRIYGIPDELIARLHNLGNMGLLDQVRHELRSVGSEDQLDRLGNGTSNVVGNVSVQRPLSPTGHPDGSKPGIRSADDVCLG